MQLQSLCWGAGVSRRPPCALERAGNAHGGPQAWSRKGASALERTAQHPLLAPPSWKEVMDTSFATKTTLFGFHRARACGCNSGLVFCLHSRGKRSLLGRQDWDPRGELEKSCPNFGGIRCRDASLHRDAAPTPSLPSFGLGSIHSQPCTSEAWGPPTFLNTRPGPGG